MAASYREHSGMHSMIARTAHWKSISTSASKRTDADRGVLVIFTFNCKAHPDAFNTYDSLGEAYMKSGKRDKAIMNFRKSLELNPENENATEMLKKLEAE